MDTCTKVIALKSENVKPYSFLKKNDHSLSPTVKGVKFSFQTFKNVYFDFPKSYQIVFENCKLIKCKFKKGVLFVMDKNCEIKF